MFPLKDSIEITCSPTVTCLLVSASVFCFVLEIFLPSELLESFLRLFGAIPCKLVEHFGWTELAQIFSSMFVHVGLAHLIGNIWFLWIFGKSVEDRIGWIRYALLYLGSGFFAVMVQVLMTPHSTLPIVGASGAISGVLGAYFICFPESKVSTFVIAGLFSRIVELPAWIFLGFWFLMQLGAGLLSMGESLESGKPMIAFWAHIGGFVLGVLSAKVFHLSEQHHRMKQSCWH